MRQEWTKGKIHKQISEKYTKDKKPDDSVRQALLNLSKLITESFADNFAWVGHNYKWIRVYLSNVFADEERLRSAHNGEHERARFTCIKTAAFPSGGILMYKLRDKVTHIVRFVGNYKQIFWHVETFYYVIYNHGFGYETENGEHADCYTKNEKRAERNAYVYY